MRKLSMCLFLFATFVGTQNLDAQKLKGLKDKLNKAFDTKAVDGYYQVFNNQGAFTFTKLEAVNTDNGVLRKWKFIEGTNVIQTLEFENEPKVKAAKPVSSAYTNSGNLYAIRTADSTFFLLKNPKKNIQNWEYNRNEDIVVVLSSNKALLDGLKDKAFESEVVKKQEDELKAMLQSIVTGNANAQKEADAQNKAEMEAKELPAPGSFSPFTGVEVIKMYEEHMMRTDGKKSIDCIYAYAAKSIQQAQPQTTWVNGSDTKVLNGVKQNIVPFRWANYIVVVKKTNAAKETIYEAREIWVKNMPADGVYDGSKFTNTYTVNGWGNPLGQYTEKAALKYKDVKGGTSKK